MGWGGVDPHPRRRGVKRRIRAEDRGEAERVRDKNVLSKPACEREPAEGVLGGEHRGIVAWVDCMDGVSGGVGSVVDSADDKISKI